MVILGYRQNYSPIHVALDPYCSLGIPYEPEKFKIVEEIIDMLLDAGANPNWRSGELYDYPALNAGSQSGHWWARAQKDDLAMLQAKLILKGASPGRIEEKSSKFIFNSTG